MPYTFTSSLTLRYAASVLDLDDVERVEVEKQLQWVEIVEAQDDPIIVSPSPSPPLPSDVGSPVESESTCSPLTPTAKRPASRSPSVGPEAKQMRLRGGAQANFKPTMTTIVFDHGRHIREDGTTDKRKLPGTELRRNARPAPSGKSISAAANSVYEIAMEILQGFEDSSEHQTHISIHEEKEDRALRLSVRYGRNYIGGAAIGTRNWCCVCFGEGDESVFRDSAFIFDVYDKHISPLTHISCHGIKSVVVS